MPSTLPTNATINITGVKTYFDWVQDVSSGNFFPFILLGLFVIIFMMFKAVSSSGKAFVGSSFICMVLAILLTTLGWLSSVYMYASIILTAFGVVWAYKEGANE